MLSMMDYQVNEELIERTPLPDKHKYHIDISCKCICA